MTLSPAAPLKRPGFWGLQCPPHLPGKSQLRANAELPPLELYDKVGDEDFDQRRLRKTLPPHKLVRQSFVRRLLTVSRQVVISFTLRARGMSGKLSSMGRSD